MNPLKHGSHLAAMWFLLLMISACATPQQSLQLIQNPPDLPLSIELKDVPFYAQRKYQCGPAALATVINHYQQLTSPEELKPLVYIPQLQGTLQAEMLSASKRYNFLAIEQDGKLESLLREVAAGHPVLVLQNLGFDSIPFWHYAVVIGYDLEQQNIVLRSGEVAQLVRPFSVFERTWKRAGYWSIVVVPHDVMPVTATQEKFTKAAVDIESGMSIGSVKMLYQSGVNRWPESYILLMGLANANLSAKKYLAAEELYRKAIQVDQKRAESWNNLAFAQLYQGNRQAALISIERAIELDPANPEIQQSKLEILNHQ